MSQLFAQLSDPHLTHLAGVRAHELLNKRILGYLSWLRRRRFEHRREVLQALEEDLGQFSLDQLLVTGDLTHIGLPREFRQARLWLERLGEPERVAVVPGNHDAYVATRWAETCAQWQAYLDPDTPGGRGRAIFPTLRVRGELAFIGLSTAVPKPPFMATGTAGHKQLALLPDLLAEAGAAGQFRVVYLHHSPVPGREKWRKRLTDAGALYRILLEQGVELVLNGHGHRAHVDELQTRDGPALAVAVPSASAMGLHGHTPARYNLYRVTRKEGGWELEIRERGYDAGSGRFGELERRSIEVRRPGRQPSPGSP